MGVGEIEFPGCPRNERLPPRGIAELDGTGKLIKELSQNAAEGASGEDIPVAISFKLEATRLFELILKQQAGESIDFGNAPTEALVKKQRWMNSGGRPFKTAMDIIIR